MPQGFGWRGSSGSLAMLAAIRRAARRAPCLAQLLICVQAPRRGVQGHTIHRPRSDRARAMVRRYLSCGRREEGEGRIRITRRGRIAGSRNDKRLAEKAPHAKSKITNGLIFRHLIVHPPNGKPNWEGVSRGERERYLAAYGLDDDEEATKARL
jgi:hypothetical protein